MSETGCTELVQGKGILSRAFMPCGQPRASHLCPCTFGDRPGPEACSKCAHDWHWGECSGLALGHEYQEATT